MLIGTSHELKDIVCNNPIYMAINIIGSASFSLFLILKNILKTKYLAKITNSINFKQLSIIY